MTGHGSRMVSRRGHIIESLDVYAGPSEVLTKPAEIRECIKKADRQIKVAKSKKRKFCSAKTPDGATICIALEGMDYSQSLGFDKKFKQIDEARRKVNHQLGETRRGIMIDIDERRSYERRFRSKVGGKLAQLERSGFDKPWVVALCIGDPDLSLRRATGAALRFLQEKASDPEGAERLKAILITSFFEPDFLTLLSKAPEVVRQDIVQKWGHIPIGGIDAIWLTMNDSKLRMNGLRSMDLVQHASLWNSDESPTAILWDRLIIDHTRHDPRLVSPDAKDARFVAVTKEGIKIVGWRGGPKTLDQFPLCLKDMARCGVLGKNFGIVEVIENKT